MIGAACDKKHEETARDPSSSNPKFPIPVKIVYDDDGEYVTVTVPVGTVGFVRIGGVDTGINPVTGNVVAAWDGKQDIHVNILHNGKSLWKSHSAEAD